MQKLSATFLMLMMCVALASVAQKKPGQSMETSKASGRQSEDHNKEVARQVFDDLFSRGRYELVNQIYDPNCRVRFGNRTVSLEQAVEEGKGYRAAAPDLKMTADHIVAHGDEVVVDWTARGTNTGSGNELKPTGKHVQMHGRTTFKFANGKIVEVISGSDHKPELERNLAESEKGGKRR